VTSGRPLFERIVERTGLSSFIGPGTVERALASVGASPDVATRDDYRRALPQLRQRMALYLRGPDLDEHVRSIEELLG